MADTVTTQVAFSGTRLVKIHLTNLSDGTGESAVKKLDISTLTGPNGLAPKHLSLMKAEGTVAGMSVKVYSNFAATATVWLLVGSNPVHICHEDVGGLVDKGTTTGDGSVMLTTDGQAAHSSYNLELTFKMHDA
jgi:hypothetical protein